MPTFFYLPAYVKLGLAVPVGDQAIAAVISTAAVLWAVVVVLVWKPQNLSRAGKQVA